MTIAVLITAYNVAATLARAVDSVLAQTRPADAIWIGDDASTDGTGKLAAGYAARHEHVRLLKQRRNLGVSAHRNALADAAHDAEWVLHLDGDDALEPNALQSLCAALAASPDAGFAFGNYRVIRGDDAREWWTDSAAHPDGGDLLLKLWARAFPGGVEWRNELLRRDLHDRIGGFESSLSLYEDWDFRLRLAAAAPGVFTAEFTSTYYREAGLSHRPLTEHLAALLAIRRDRRGLIRGRPKAADADRMLRRELASLARDATREARSQGRRVGAVGAYARALVLDPLHPQPSLAVKLMLPRRPGVLRGDEA